MSIRLTDNVVIEDNPNVQSYDVSSSSAEIPALADIVTGTTVSNSQVLRFSVPNFVTRETFENTDSGRDVTYFDSMDELLDSLDS